MNGNPLFRVLVLTALLAVLGVLVSGVARSPDTVVRSGPATASAPGTSGEDSLPTVLGIQLSAPATSLSLTSVNGEVQHIASYRPDELATEFRVRLPIRKDSITTLLSIEWESPASSRFVRLVLEPEGLDSRELILHAPDDLENHAITFQWPRPENNEEVREDPDS